MLRRHFFLAGALLALVLMIVAGAFKLTLGASAGAARANPPGAGAAPVSVVRAQPRDFIESIDALGVAKGRQSITLSAATTQLVSRVRFQPGQTVAKDQVLIELKADEQDAGLVQAQAKAVQAERDYQRWKALAEKGFAPKASVDQYEAVWLSAKADVAAAQARHGDRVIRAPFAGVVGLTDIAPGAVINPGSAIVTLDDIGAVRVDFQVPDRFLSAVHEGQAVRATADAYPGAVIEGRIAKLDTRIDERTRALTARAEFPNPDHRLKPGMMMRISVARGSRQGLAVPESAVAVQGDAAFVYVLSQQGAGLTAERRPVVTGARQGGFVEIRDGVAAGDRVVADGLNKVQHGQAVRVANEGGAGAGGSRSGA